MDWPPLHRALHWTQRQMLWLLLSTYVLGAFVPAFGLRLRAVTLGSTNALGKAGGISLPVMMVGVLLFVAALGAKTDEIRSVVRRPVLLLAGLSVNAVYPILFATLAALVLGSWHNLDEGQSILAGLAMVGAMPIAGASTAWSQNTDGNLALSLGLVWGSTFLSPMTTPLVLYAMSHVTLGDLSTDLHRLARQGSSIFVLVAVVVPSVLGLVVRAIAKAPRIGRVMPALKLLNLVDLLVLSYSNASVTLPQAVAQPDPDFLFLVLGVALLMCVGAFALGWWIPRHFRASRGEQTALMFGLGMSNNGSGLVLASTALPHHPRVLLTILLYNLVQQSIAGIVDAHERRMATKRSKRAKRAFEASLHASNNV